MIFDDWTIAGLVGIALTLPLWAWLLLTRHRSPKPDRGHGSAAA